MDVELQPGAVEADGEPIEIETSAAPLPPSSSTVSQNLLTEFEAVRLCCSFVLFGAPVCDSLQPAPTTADGATSVESEVSDCSFQLPSSLLHCMGIHTSNHNAAYITPYDWSLAVSRCQIKQSPDKLQHFYSQVWLPFCHSISARKVLSHSQHKLVVPNPLLNITDHHYAARGLCHLFLIRQQLLRAAQYVLTHDVQLLIDYLRSPAGRNVDNMPLWWCPWIHDLGVLIGLVKYGFLSLREMKNDADLPFTPAYLDTHVRQVFLFGSSSMLPCGADDLSTPAESEQFVQAAVLMFPEYRDLECRVMRILEDVTRGLSVEQHAYKVQSFQALRLVHVASSTNVEDSQHEAAGEGDEDHLEAMAAPSGRSGRGAKKDFPLSRSGRAVNKYPAMPLKRFQRETAKRRKLCASISHPECFRDLYSGSSAVTGSSSSTSSVCGSATTLMETNAAVSVEA